jgi:hypothetical protein
MLATDASLSDIALSCGFADQAHLCKHFRLAVGQTPAAWRREHRLEYDESTSHSRVLSLPHSSESDNETVHEQQHHRRPTRRCQSPRFQAAGRVNGSGW